MLRDGAPHVKSSLPHMHKNIITIVDYTYTHTFTCTQTHTQHMHMHTDILEMKEPRFFPRF